MPRAAIIRLKCGTVRGITARTIRLPTWFASSTVGDLPRNPLKAWLNGSTAIPANTAPTASTTSGASITHGDSWAWSPASGGVRSSPQKVRKYARKV